MALFDIFKKRKKKEWTERFREKTKEKARSISEERKDAAEEQKEKKAQTVFASNLASSILISPVITERSTFLADSGAYVFHVRGGATKPQIKRAVEELYRAKVTRVRVLHVKPKQRRMRGIIGTKSGYKKAIVTLEKGKKIEFV